jgi:glycosyltransferase involved in cell wall biosynthesis
MFGFRAIGQGSGGVERAAEELCTRLAARGHGVTAFCRARYNEKALSSYEGVRLVNVPSVYTKHLEAISHSFLAACRSAHGFDVVHVHGIGPSLVSFIPRLSRTPTVVTAHALDWRREKWGVMGRASLRIGAWTAARIPSRTIVVSRTLQAFFRDHLGRETLYIPNGITPVTRRPAAQIRRFGVAGDDYVLYIGRLVPEKGCHTLIRAFRAVSTPLKLLVVGGGTHTDDYLRTLRAAAEGDSRIVFTGPLYGEEKDEVYSNARCMVLPSTLEGMPIVLLEALSSACPVLCSNIPENIEVLAGPPGEDGAAERYARLFQAGSAEDLRGQLERVLADPSEARDKALAAQKDIATLFSWDRVVEQTEAVYADLLGLDAPRG